MSAAPRQAALPLRAAVLSDAAAAAGMVLPANETSGTVAAGADAVQAHKPGRAVGVAAAAGAGQSAPTEAVAAAATAVAGGTAGTATTIAARANSAAGGSSPIADLCPHIVKAVPPPRAVQAGLGGMVLVRAAIKGGKVRRVEILKSEPVGLFDGAVRAALAQYVCRDQGDVEVLAEQWFEFKLAE